jgi:hypothetical protein
MEELGGFPMERKKGKGRVGKKRENRKPGRDGGALFIPRSFGVERFWFGATVRAKKRRNEDGTTSAGRAKQRGQRGVDERNKQKQLSSSIGSALFYG